MSRVSSAAGGSVSVNIMWAAIAVVCGAVAGAVTAARKATGRTNGARNEKSRAEL